MKKIFLAFVMLICASVPALAANCAAYPYTLTNGTTADANQVMADFNNILSCGNNLLLGRNNNLSDLQSASSSRTNLGLGSAAQEEATNPGGEPVASVASAVSGNLVGFNDNVGTIANTGVPVSAMLTQSTNLAGLSSVATARSNLGLGSIAVQNVTYSTSGPTGTANSGDFWIQYAP